MSSAYNKYFPLKNARKYVSQYEPVLIENEEITVPSEPDERGRFCVRLKELPADLRQGANHKPLISGMVETNGPAIQNNQFLVDYKSGYVYFNYKNKGKTVYVTYYGLGSSVNAEDINYLYDRINSITGDLNYVHIQTLYDTRWVVHHNLNKKPSVTLLDTDGVEFEAEVNYLDDNTLEVLLAKPAIGKVICN